MMKRLLLALALCALSAPAWATCAVTNLTLKDAAASPVTALVPYADDGSGGSNCSPQIQIKQGGNVAVVLSGGALKVDASATTQPVSSTTLATSAKQDTEIALLQGTGILTANQGTANATPWNVNVNNTNANGQAAMAASSPVVIASNQSTIPVQRANDYPVSAIPITASATGTTSATTATLAASASGLKTYICSMSIRANATAAATGNATVTGTITGTLNFTQWTAPTASGLGVTEMIFSPCVPSSTTNTAIAVVSAAPGTSGVVSVTATGYQGN